MSKLFLLKSDHDREKIGDVVIVLDKVESFHAFTLEDDYCLSIHTNDDDNRAWFKNKELFIAEFKRFVTALGEDDSLVDEIVLQERKRPKKDIHVVMGNAIGDALKKAMEE